MTGRARVVAGAAVAVVILVVLAVAARTGGEGSGSSAKAPAAPAASGTVSPSAGETGVASSPTPTWEGPTPPPIDTTLRLGAESAPVTIVEFGDFQCTSCGRFAREIKPALVRKYVDTGVVRMYWRDFPAFGKESERAAVAARAAARQGRFWAFHDALYADQPPLRSGKITDAFLRGIARTAGLDLARFDADRKDKALRTAMRKDFEFGQLLGVPGTPAFLIDGEPFFGAQPLSAFERAIQKARANRS